MLCPKTVNLSYLTEIMSASFNENSQILGMVLDDIKADFFNDPGDNSPLSAIY